MRASLVIGLGVSGKAAATFLIHKGYTVFGVDDRIDKSPVSDLRILCIEEAKTRIEDREFEFCIVSPGISPTHLLYQTARLHHIPLISEVELGLRDLSQIALGITGTNGKTTVTSLVTHILCASGRKARALGNIGDPVCLYALNPDPEEILVVELSSYQLESMHTPLFHAAALLNITPDHLDRYCSMEEYARAKWQIQYCIQKGGRLLVRSDVVEAWGYLYHPDGMRDCSLCSIDQNADIDRENETFSIELLKCLHIGEKEARGLLSTFIKPSHRIEYLGKIDGVYYFDDSKGTNLDAVKRAVQVMPGNVYLIAGGVDKGASYLYWRECFQGKVQRVFALGAAKDKMAIEVGSFCPVQKVETLQEAVLAAACLARGGDSILLSPGCSSFDMFDDYAHRGREFQRCVQRIGEERRKKNL